MRSAEHWGTGPPPQQQQQQQGEDTEAPTKAQQDPNFGLSGALAKEANTVRGVELLYTEPPEARKPNLRWRLYVFKNGALRSWGRAAQPQLRCPVVTTAVPICLGSAGIGPTSQAAAAYHQSKTVCVSAHSWQHQQHLTLSYAGGRQSVPLGAVPVHPCCQS